MTNDSLDTHKEKPLSRIATERREQILEAALHCFAKNGFHQSSMAEVCAEAKLSPGSVYRYFRSKEDIIAGLAEAEHQHMAKFYEKVRRLPTLTEAIDALISFWIDTNTESDSADSPQAEVTLNYFTVYIEIGAEATRNPRIAAIAHKYDTAQLAIIQELLEKGKQNGELDVTISLAMLSRLLSATLDGLMFRCAYDKSLAPQEYRAETRQFLHRALGMK